MIVKVTARRHEGPLTGNWILIDNGTEFIRHRFIAELVPGIPDTGMIDALLYELTANNSNLCVYSEVDL